MNNLKKHHTVFGDYYADAESLSLEERQALEAHNKEVQLEQSRPKGKGTWELLAGTLCLISAIFFAFIHNYQLSGLGVVGSIYLIIRGLSKKIANRES